MYTHIKKGLKLVTFFSAITTLGISIATLNDSMTAASIAAFIWFISPYGYLAFLINLVATKPATHAAMLITTLCCIYGLVSLIDATLINDSSQALTALSFPSWQWAGLSVATFPLVLLNKLKNK